jgi:predicted membrane-bound mannosyltransferase
MFTGLWGFGLAAAYTVIPYKTPWLALSFLMPMGIIAGYAVNELFTSDNVIKKIFAAVLAVSSTGVLVFQTCELNFVRYDDNDMPYIYAHTKREFLDMMDKIEYYADKSRQGKKATIEIVSPDYWPMVWYTKDFEHANYQGQVVDVSTAEMIVAKKDEQDEAVVKRYSAHYKYVGKYPLRPGVDLMLLVRKDLADRDAQDLYKILGVEPLNVYPDEEQPVDGRK